MEIKEFQKLSRRTLNKELNQVEQLSNMIIGIMGESGEVADALKKHLFQYHPLDVEHLAEEMGDVMFYIVNLATLIGIEMEDVLEKNVRKLEKRYPNGFNSENSINRE